MSLRWILSAAGLFAAFVFLHWPITAFCEALVQRIGFATYEGAVGAGGVLAGLAAAALLSRRRHGASAQTWAFLMALFGVIALAQPTLVLINIENIHFPQYALLAILLTWGGLAPQGTWLTATGLGIVDEAYQYLFLQAGRPDRLDWNDITFNAIGAAIGVVLLLHYELTRPHARLARLSWRVIVAVLAPLVIVALLAVPPVYSPFYAVTPHGLRSHELTPGEGLLLVGGLWIALQDLLRRLADRETAVPILGPLMAFNRNQT